METPSAASGAANQKKAVQLVQRKFSRIISIERSQV